MRNSKDFEYRTLTPEQWVELRRRVMREAHDARAQSLQALYRAIFRSLRAAGTAVRRLAGASLRFLAVTAGTVWAAYDAWLERRRAVRALGALDDRVLKDLGLHRCEIESAVLGRSWAARIPLSTAPVPVEATRGKRRANGGREPKHLVHCSAAA